MYGLGTSGGMLLLFIDGLSPFANLTNAVPFNVFFIQTKPENLNVGLGRYI